MQAFVPFDNANAYRTTALCRVRDKDLTGKVVIVTGGAGALGNEIVVALSSAGATVISAGRSLQKLEAAIEAAVARMGDALKGQIECAALDLGDYDSIKAFVAEVQGRHTYVDVLINNAGMVPPKTYKQSKYGLEVTYQTNFFSTVVLTELMLPLIRTPSGRIIHVSSMSHAGAQKPINWDVVPSTEQTYEGYAKEYAESKWLLTAYSSALNHRTEPTGVVSVCADPGVSPDSAMWDEQAFFVRFMARYVLKWLTKSSSQAAGCATHLAVTDSVEGGGYYQSGLLVAPLRPDCNSPEEWTKMNNVLRQYLPDDLKKLVV